MSQYFNCILSIFQHFFSHIFHIVMHFFCHGLHILYILRIPHPLIDFLPQPLSMTVNLSQQLSMSSVNKHVSCISFPSPPYWDVFLLFQWKKRDNTHWHGKENQQTFLELLVINARTVAMDVGGGTWTAGPWDQAIMEIKNERHWDETRKHNMQNM